MRGNSRKTGLEQVYTLPHVAEMCWAEFEKWWAGEWLIEPAAGGGAFMRWCDAGYDIDPRYPGIIRCDSLLEPFPYGASYITNPPFGRRCELSLKFFNKLAACEARLIGFLIPCSWRKGAFQNRLDKRYRLVSDIDMPAVAFEGVDRGVLNTCFQVWQRCEESRPEWRRTGLLRPFYVAIRRGDKIPQNVSHVVCMRGWSCGRLETIKEHVHSVAKSSVYCYFDFSAAPQIVDNWDANAIREAAQRTSGSRVGASLGIGELEDLLAL
jgi:hypothetical protein